MGTLSLEIYLIHLYFLIVYVQKHGLGHLLTLLFTITVSLLLAFILHNAIAFLTRFLPK
ncbi:hypothetical protein [Prevotella koreensis]|uniref:hypothetical protein n=1 Tax=Prevotella koreensis TaxID=2490854 RepID=UPI0028EE0561|nr:hypothetical protein [Prevotella koreensis]